MQRLSLLLKRTTGWRCMNATGLLFAVLLFILARTAAGADPAEILRSELATRIVGRQVTISLERGATVHRPGAGCERSVSTPQRQQELRPAPLYPGRNHLPRTAITEIRVLEQRGEGLRVGGAVLGSLVSFGGGMAIGESMPESSSSAANVVTIAVWAAAPRVATSRAGERNGIGCGYGSPRRLRSREHQLSGKSVRAWNQAEVHAGSQT